MRPSPSVPIRAGLIALALALAGAAHGGIFDFTAEPLPGDTYTRAHFRLYIPDSADLARGIYFYVDPYNVDSRYIVEDPHFRALVEANEFALMGAWLDASHAESGIFDGLLRGLVGLALASERTEIQHATLFFDGWSWGGQFSYHFTKWLPERVIGFVTQKGGLHETDPAGAAILVPGYLVIGELDLSYRIKNLTDIFENHRPAGARWILAMEPGAGHGRVTDRNLLDDYFETVAAARLPATIPPFEPPVLSILPEEESWLGDRDSQAIGAFECYTGAIGGACWFPSRRVGEFWQGFVSDSTVTDTIPCAPTAVVELEARAPRGPVLLEPAPNPFSPAMAGRVTLRFTLPRAARVEVGIYGASGRLVRVIDAGRRAGGAHAVHWDGRAAGGDPAASGVYVARLRLDDGAGPSGSSAIGRTPSPARKLILVR
jgi:hypothetical protein